jgi:2-phosphosulfolactate phosphatase
MKIQILQLLEGAKNAKGLAVVIDVFRAFSMACYLADKGIARYIAVKDIEVAYKIKNIHPDWLLIGERHERLPEGFDYGNSPTHIQNVDFTGKSIIHTTSAGTQGLILACKSAEEVLTGSLVNAEAIANYIKEKNPDMVSLVCMGYDAISPADEDILCANYIKSIIENKSIDITQQIEELKNTSGRRLFLEENQNHSPYTDFYFCTSLNKFNFVLKASTKLSDELQDYADEIVELIKG